MRICRQAGGRGGHRKSKRISVSEASASGSGRPPKAPQGHLKGGEQPGKWQKAAGAAHRLVALDAGGREHDAAADAVEGGAHHLVPSDGCGAQGKGTGGGRQYGQRRRGAAWDASPTTASHSGRAPRRGRALRQGKWRLTTLAHGGGRDVEDDVAGLPVQRAGLHSGLGALGHKAVEDLDLVRLRGLHNPHRAGAGAQLRQLHLGGALLPALAQVFHWAGLGTRLRAQAGRQAGGGAGSGRSGAAETRGREARCKRGRQSTAPARSLTANRTR